MMATCLSYGDGVGGRKGWGNGCKGWGGGGSVDMLQVKSSLRLDQYSI